MAFPEAKTRTQLTEWIGSFWILEEQIQTYSLLQRLGTHIHQNLSYQLRKNLEYKRWGKHWSAVPVRVVTLRCSLWKPRGA